MTPLAATQLQLLESFMADAPSQPATNFWRCVELPVLAAALPAEGRGLDVGCSLARRRDRGDYFAAARKLDDLDSAAVLPGFELLDAEEAAARTRESAVWNGIRPRQLMDGPP